MLLCSAAQPTEEEAGAGELHDACPARRARNPCCDTGDGQGDALGGSGPLNRDVSSAGDSAASVLTCMRPYRLLKKERMLGGSAVPAVPAVPAALPSAAGTKRLQA